jgi:hypothetical protein
MTDTTREKAQVQDFVGELVYQCVSFNDGEVDHTLAEKMILGYTQALVAAALEGAAQKCVENGKGCSNRVLACHASDAMEIKALISSDAQAALDAHDDEIRAKAYKSWTFGCFVCGKQAPQKERHHVTLCDEHKEAFSKAALDTLLREKEEGVAKHTGGDVSERISFSDSCNY